jgi:hypothetical protein
MLKTCQFLTNEYQVGLKSWKKNTNGTIDEDWFVGQVSSSLLVPINAVLSAYVAISISIC